MTTINNTLNPALTGATGTSKAAGAMDQTDFLRLMTTQLTTQDPFNPVDNTQMVAQMAQVSQVAGIAEMNKSLQTIAAGLTPSLTLSVIRAQDPIGRPRLSVARPSVEVRLSPGVPYARLLVLSAPLERFYYDPTLLDEIGPESLEMSEDPIEPTPDQI